MHIRIFYLKSVLLSLGCSWIKPNLKRKQIIDLMLCLEQINKEYKIYTSLSQV